MQRNENTVITATLSPTRHTISSTSSTAIITATIVARSSKAVTSTVDAAGTVSSAAAIARGAHQGGTVPSAPSTNSVASKPTMPLSKDKKGESQKRVSSQSAVCENGFYKKGRASPPPSLRKSSHLRNLKRRHTVGGTKDFEKFRLLVGSQFDRQDPVPATSQAMTASSAWERLRPAVPSEERSMKSWLRRERLRTSSPDLHGHVVVVQSVAPKMVPSAKGPDLMDVDVASVTATIGRHEQRPSSTASRSPPALESQV